MTLQDLSNIYNHCGYNAAMTAIEDEKLTPGKKDDLYEELERLQEEDAEKLAAYDFLEF